MHWYNMRGHVPQIGIRKLFLTLSQYRKESSQKLGVGQKYRAQVRFPLTADDAKHDANRS